MLRWFKWMYNFYLKHKSAPTDVPVPSLIVEFSVLSDLYLFLPQQLKNAKNLEAFIQPKMSEHKTGNYLKCS